MIPLTELCPQYLVPRIILGGWQFSAGHGPASLGREQSYALWDRALDQGLNTFDCADIYTGVESLIGAYSAARKARGVAPPQVHTKFVPDLAALPTLGRPDVEKIVDRSLRRLRVDRLDLVQFHWWDYAIPGYLDAIGWLGDLAKDGKIRAIGLTNFDTTRLRELVATGVEIVSLQLQYSVLDQRPRRGLDAVAVANRVALLGYGSLAGGFLSPAWVGVDAPDALANRSLVKYRLIIEESGGWAAFQRVLGVLGRIGERYDVPLAAVAIRWVLDQPGVAAAIVGCRKTEHLETIGRVFGWSLSPDDRRLLDEVANPSIGPAGDVYQAERDMSGKHAAIMRYDLNARADD